MPINVYYLSLTDAPKNGYWDYSMINDLFNNEMWLTDFQSHEVDTLPEKDRAVVVIPGRHHKGLEEKVNKELKKIGHVVFFCMGDEEAEFEVNKIIHDSIHIWVQNPHPEKHDKYNKIGTGYAQAKPSGEYKKTIGVFFSGQITHSRRREMLDNLISYQGDAHINPTKGFTQGYKPEEYIELMKSSKIVPCPSGAVIPDSFRVFESLECMAMPIADEVNPTGTITRYWEWLLKDPPFPLIKDWRSLAGYIEDIEQDYPRNLHQQTAWWLNYKREFARKVMEQCETQQ